MHDDVVLRSDDLEVVLRPARGCDVVTALDLATDTQLLFRTPWAGRAPAAAAWDDRSRWLSGYPGGWQVLCPNAGPAREVDGATQGFHGEAALVPWQVLDRSPTCLTAQVELFGAPLLLHRAVQLDGGVLRVEDTVTNAGDAPRSVAWVQHVGFGAPLLAEGSRLHLPSCTVRADPQAPGTLLAPDSTHPWPWATSAAGGSLDLRELPGPHRPREVFAALTDLAAGWCAVTNPERGVGVSLRWDVDRFPYAWLWQEMHATSSFPWFGRAYVLGIEPANVLPDHGRSRPPAPVLAPGETWAARIQLSVFRPDDILES